MGYFILHELKTSSNSTTESDVADYHRAIQHRFIPLEKSKYPGYKTWKTRVLSFNIAPKWMEARKEDFAKFGFFYEGKNLLSK